MWFTKCLVLIIMLSEFLVECGRRPPRPYGLTVPSAPVKTLTTTSSITDKPLVARNQTKKVTNIGNQYEGKAVAFGSILESILFETFNDLWNNSSTNLKNIL